MHVASGCWAPSSLALLFANSNSQTRKPSRTLAGYTMDTNSILLADQATGKCLDAKGTSPFRIPHTMRLLATLHYLDCTLPPTNRRNLSVGTRKPFQQKHWSSTRISPPKAPGFLCVHGWQGMTFSIQVDEQGAMPMPKRIDLAAAAKLILGAGSPKPNVWEEKGDHP